MQTGSMDDIIWRSLISFAEEALAGDWRGRREREAVSMYAFGCLLREVRAGGIVYDPAQITIEFPVPQVTGRDGASVSAKNQVCKDLVIWPRPGMTCWDDEGKPTVPPAAILEWKFGAPTVYEPDVEWLQAFTKMYPETVGYAITANRPGSAFLLECVRVTGGVAERQWLRL